MPAGHRACFFQCADRNQTRNERPQTGSVSPTVSYGTPAPRYGLIEIAIDVVGLGHDVLGVADVVVAGRQAKPLLSATERTRSISDEA